MQDALVAAAEQDAAAAANARQRADQLLAEAEVAAAERMLEAAELEFSSAKRQQVILQQELGQVSVGWICILSSFNQQGSTLWDLCLSEHVPSLDSVWVLLSRNGTTLHAVCGKVCWPANGV